MTRPAGRGNRDAACADQKQQQPASYYALSSQKLRKRYFHHVRHVFSSTYYEIVSTYHIDPHNKLFVQKMIVRCLGIFFLVARDLYESDKEQK